GPLARLPRPPRLDGRPALRPRRPRLARALAPPPLAGPPGLLLRPLLRPRTGPHLRRFRSHRSAAPRLPRPHARMDGGGARRRHAPAAADPRRHRRLGLPRPRPLGGGAARGALGPRAPAPPRLRA